MNAKSTKQKADSDETSFESKFHRLEEILEKMNSGEANLDEALGLYEEADRLISFCTKRLNDAEKRVEVLIKNRATGELTLGNDQKPAVQEFSPPK